MPKDIKKRIKERKQDVRAVKRLAMGSGTVSDSARLARVQAEPRPMRRSAQGKIVARPPKRKRR
jgi:hypothetical protein